MEQQAKGQVSRSAAEVYEEFFLPAIFQPWAERMAEAVRVGPGDRVLDVACGTGVAARAIADRVRPGGSVVGLDVNDGMLTVARCKAPAVEWVEGRAEALPFDAERFDAVVSQFGIMFFDDRRRAVREMVRVLRPGGRLAVAAWDALDRTPGYAAMVALLQRLFGDEAAESLRAPYSLGDPDNFLDLFEREGLADLRVATHAGTARFPSIASWVYTDIRGWTASDLIDDDGFERLVAAAEGEMQPFVTPDGAVAFDAPAHIVTAVKS